MAARSMDVALPTPDSRCADEAFPVREAGRALVVVTPASAGAVRAKLWHSHAPFVAQLIATAAGLAQTRARRRAAPTEVTRSYSAISAYKPQRSSGRRLQRAI